MRFTTVVTSFVVALASSRGVAAVCCAECIPLHNACMTDCQADGTSEPACTKICYGGDVSKSFRVAPFTLTRLDGLSLQLRGLLSAPKHGAVSTQRPEHTKRTLSHGFCLHVPACP